MECSPNSNQLKQELDCLFVASRNNRRSSKACLQKRGISRFALLGREKMDSEKYLPELMAEKDSLDPSFQHSLRLLDQEIENIQKDEGKEDEKFIDVVINKNMKLGQKVLIPVKQFPKFNFVGKLLGPRGNSLKRLQEDTLTKMSILGKGSMRDKDKEEELRKSGESKYQHLNEDLHVLIEVFAPPAEAYARMGHALEEIKKFLIPDYNDEIRQAQLQELTYLNGGSEEAKVPVVRGKPAVRGRGTPTPGPPRSRGGVPPPQAVVPRGAAPRGAPQSRVPASRGRGVPAQRARGAPPSTGYRPPPPIVQDTYGEYEYDDGYGTAYDDQGYNSYDTSYSNQGQNSSDYYEYGHDISEDSYDSYGQEEWTNKRHKAPPARTTKGVYREQPYSRY
ncbi:KH domain-containing, RNA-binding, signal transduction-associated protein 3 isoform X2 [Anguilla anguilla]|uniref:KH domain-containing, RNA-binding, signal transduction-associated protein 3 isoform X2 n=1 Tax=Anguilla anguilla TaxID=7936 RepID=UPI0015ACEB62|nr:KH domain-containing, RNA-binding, signal transduction-associated protein 3 isoform X2 [Anguilla anguilla]